MENTIVKRLLDKDKPGIRIFNKYILSGTDQAYCYVYKHPVTLQVVGESVPFYILLPERRTIRNRNKYTNALMTRK